MHLSHQNHNPEQVASFFSKLWFWWFNSMVTKGYRSPLNQEDMWKLSKKNQTQHIADMLEAQIIRKKKKYLEIKKKEKVKLNIMIPIFKMYWSHMIFIAVIKLIPSCLTFAGPILLNELIGFMKYGEQNAINELIVKLISLSVRV